MVSTLDSAITMAEMPFYGDPRRGPIAVERRCVCGTVLSRYQSSDRCWPCQERMRDRTIATPPPVVAPRRAQPKNLKTRQAEYKRIIAWARKQTEPFKTSDVADAFGLQPFSASGYLRRGHRDGLIAHAGITRHSTVGNVRCGGYVMLWEARR